MPITNPNKLKPLRLAQGIIEDFIVHKNDGMPDMDVKMDDLFNAVTMQMLNAKNS